MNFIEFFYRSEFMKKPEGTVWKNTVIVKLERQNYNERFALKTINYTQILDSLPRRLPAMQIVFLCPVYETSVFEISVPDA